MKPLKAKLIIISIWAYIISIVMSAIIGLKEIAKGLFFAGVFALVLFLIGIVSYAVYQMMLDK